MTSPKPIALEDIAALIARLRDDAAYLAGEPPWNQRFASFPLIEKDLREAADALAALSPAAQVPREPTEGMLIAGAGSDFMAPGRAVCYLVWRAMYDAALAERGQDRDKP